MKFYFILLTPANIICMKTILTILVFSLLIACKNSEKHKFSDCDYLDKYMNGNTKVNPRKIGKRMIDPIDDTLSYKKTKFGLVVNGHKVYKKAKTHARCEDEYIDIEYFQDFTDKIDIESYREIDRTFFASKNKVYFWWANSGGNMLIPLDVDAETFEPFEDICGGIDKKAVYYGCPNRGIYPLNIPLNSEFEFIPQKGNYWNSPKHQVIVDEKLYDVKWEFEKGYFCDLKRPTQ